MDQWIVRSMHAFGYYFLFYEMDPMRGRPLKVVEGHGRVYYLRALTEKDHITSCHSFIIDIYISEQRLCLGRNI